ncbi:hypothetical protein [Rhizohabitans arisaemae]|nr:hypothetical protein [Rhizohabitans arisaemae]
MAVTDITGAEHAAGGRTMGPSMTPQGIAEISGSPAPPCSAGRPALGVPA